MTLILYLSIYIYIEVNNGNESESMEKIEKQSNPKVYGAISEKFHVFKHHCLCQSRDSLSEKKIDWMIEQLYDLSLCIYFSFPLLLYFIKTSIVFP